MTRRTALLVAVLVAATALLVSTGAVPLSDGTDEIAQVDIEMSPADGANGKYAVINKAGEIEILLTDENPDLDGSGVTDDTVAPIDRVFTITNTGTEPARVWIADDAEDVHFYRGEDPTASLEGPTNEITLLPNETVAVGLLVDTRGDHDVENVSGFSVHVEQGTPTPDPTTTTTTEPTPEPTTTTTTTEPTTTTTTTETTTTTTTTTTEPTPELTTTTATEPTPEPTSRTTAEPTPTDTLSTTPTPETTAQEPTTAGTGGGGTTTTVSDGLGSLRTEGPTTTDESGPAIDTTETSSGDDDSSGGPLAEIGGLDTTRALGLPLLLLVVLALLTAYRRYWER